MTATATIRRCWRPAVNEQHVRYLARGSGFITARVAPTGSTRIQPRTWPWNASPSWGRGTPSFLGAFRRGIVSPRETFPPWMMRGLTRLFWIAIAVLFLVEEWLWRWLSAFLERLVAAVGLARMRARLAAWIDRLPPAAALLLFLLPGVVLLPLKVIGLWMLARGHW